MDYTENNTLHLEFISDAGHGWLKVNLDMIPFEILKTISSYSYQHCTKEYDSLGNPIVTRWVYLEEDCDATKFIESFGRELISYEDIYHGRTSNIRQFDRFRL